LTYSASLFVRREWENYARKICPPEDYESGINMPGKTTWRRMRWVGHVAHMGDMRNMYKILVRKPKGKRPHRRPRYTWKNIRMDLGNRVGKCRLEASGSGYRTVVGSCGCSKEPSAPLKLGNFLIV
jgi:hypothetical protein